MGISERKEREKEQRRSDIVDAAEKIFFKKGFEYATMDEIAEQAELSKGTLYLYFKSKEELLYAIHLRAMKIIKGLFESAIDQKPQNHRKSS
ncbi:MAG: helix-turn-helix transcriptional regulator [Bacteroidales bacterium]|nr:helix-turn-helix transcriptional regulator [Bacteroidales bacterium]